MRRGVVAALALLGLSGCGPHQPARLGGLPREVTVYVVVSDRVAQADDGGNVAAMLDVLESELREEARVVSILGARRDEAPPVPRLELQVLDSNAGDAQARGAADGLNAVSGFTGVGVVGVGLGSVLVDAYIVPSGGQKPRYVGRFQSSGFGATSEQSIAAGERVGGSIASALRRAPE